MSDNLHKPIWFKCSEKMPPKTEPFLALTTSLIEIMEWKERIISGESKGFFGFYCPCSCCNGYCSDNFELWTYLPIPPE